MKKSLFTACFALTLSLFACGKSDNQSIKDMQGLWGISTSDPSSATVMKGTSDLDSAVFKITSDDKIKLLAFASDNPDNEEGAREVGTLVKKDGKVFWQIINMDAKSEMTWEGDNIRVRDLNSVNVSILLVRIGKDQYKERYNRIMQAKAKNGNAKATAPTPSTPPPAPAAEPITFGDYIGNIVVTIGKPTPSTITKYVTLRLIQKESDVEGMLIEGSIVNDKDKVIGGFKGQINKKDDSKIDFVRIVFNQGVLKNCGGLFEGHLVKTEKNITGTLERDSSVETEAYPAGECGLVKMTVSLDRT